ncbi:MAG: hypothetical protein ACK5YW_09665 [Betaproteobacteria bacterium]|jgi:hypothetical protein|nr:hypothetical protein [Rhodocyclaceae bacterium]MCA3140734.1 hypothetical protein [Rhodocyclaceae bacterium]MCE2897711.1 hypothetical protein [Betaproteobacteria bacterium]
MQPQTKPRGRGKWILYLLVLPLVLVAAYTWFSLTWSYSQGERAGYVQKLSKRGWLCKTWEGELALVTMPGTVAEKFFFTVRRQEVAERINNSMGQRVSLEYHQHLGVPTNCFGDSQYFVDNVRLVQEPTLPPTSTAMPPPAPAAAPAETAPPAAPPAK